MVFIVVGRHVARLTRLPFQTRIKLRGQGVSLITNYSKRLFRQLDGRKIILMQQISNENNTRSSNSYLEFRHRQCRQIIRDMIYSCFVLFVCLFFFFLISLLELRTKWRLKKKKKKISPPDRGEFKTSIYVYILVTGHKYDPYFLLFTENRSPMAF